VVVVGTPYGFWQRLFIEKLAQGAHAPELLTYDAARGDLQTVEALLSYGVPVDARDRRGATALHGAAGGGQLNVADYLLANGADVNAVNIFGDTPLENALSMNRTEMSKFLTERGGKRIRGSEEQRNKAIKDIVREQVEEFKREMAK
jgi:ankyrin repeat protein